jgi:hypothetical protein
MADAIWPIDRYLLLGLEVDPGDGAIRTPVARGAHRQRPSGSAPPETLSGSLSLSGADLAIFREWGITTLRRWTLPFKVPDPETGAYRRYQFAGRPVWGMGTTADHLRRRWSVEVTLETLP